MRAQTVSIGEKIAFLSQTKNYSETTSTVEALETHMSWVFMTHDYVYKMRKPIRLSFLDFRTLADREHYGRESLRLNRRLAPDVYLDLLPLTVNEAGRLRLGGSGRVVEWLEKMRRLPRHAMLDCAIKRNTVKIADVDRFMAVLLDFYQRTGPVATTSDDYQRRFAQAIEANYLALAQPDFRIPQGLLKKLTAAQEEFVSSRGQLFDDRIAKGRVIEAHGDLRPEHVCLAPEPEFIDCIEFDRELRVLDIADELAFLAMECEMAGAAFIGTRIFDQYRARMGDELPDILIHFYKAHRATVRAKLSAWHVEDYPVAEHPSWLRQAERYLQLAASYVAQW